MVLRTLHVELREKPLNKTAKHVTLGTSTLLTKDTQVKLPGGHTALYFKKGAVPTEMCDRTQEKVWTEQFS